jgi:hypothetical protein
LISLYEKINFPSGSAPTLGTCGRNEPGRITQKVGRCAMGCAAYSGRAGSGGTT